MSYVICSNDYDEENDLYSEVNSPASFQNILSNGGGLRIPKNAEIAVQSVKINKSPNIVVGPDFRFYVYFGQDYTDGFNESTKNTVTSYPIEIRPFVERLTLTREQFADEVEDAINLHLTHPLAFHEQVTEVHDNASGQFAGYTLNFKQTDLDPIDGSNEYTEADIIPFEQEGNLGFTYNPMIQQLTSSPGYGPAGAINDNTRHSRQCIFPNFALVGKHSIDPPDEDPDPDELEDELEDELFEANPGLNDTPLAVGGLSTCTEWAVGLIRGAGGHFKKYPIYFNLRHQYHPHSESNRQVYMTENCYFDYVVGAFRNGNSGNRYLRVFESSVDRDYGTQEEALQDDTPIVMNEIKYWGDHSNHFDDVYNWSTNHEYYDGVEIYLNGENISVTIDGHIDLVNSAAQPDSKRENLFKPINQACWCLFPKFWIMKPNQSMFIYHAPKLPDEVHPGDKDITYFNENQWWADIVQKGLEVQVGKEIDTRFFNIIDTPEVHEDLRLSDDGNHTNIFDDYKFTIIVKPTPTYFAPLANADGLLGFRGRAIVHYSTDNSDQAKDGGIMTSTNNPNANGKSLFVRLSNFTHQSFNAGNGNRSKIIFHLPRFDNTGRDEGDGLYFESSERFYLKLNNTEEFVQSAFDIDIVDDKEIVARDELRGQTIVCLHIQSSKN